MIDENNGRLACVHVYDHYTGKTTLGILVTNGKTVTVMLPHKNKDSLFTVYRFYKLKQGYWKAYNNPHLRIYDEE